MKVLFLDVDGVLNHFPVESPIERSAVRYLNSVVSRTGARIVIASNWRKRASHTKVAKALHAKGFRGKLIGATPALYTKVEGIYYPRGEEVRQWLEGEDHPNWHRKENGPIEAFAILDDSNYYPPEMEPYRVKPDPRVGFQKDDAERLVHILGESPVRQKHRFLRRDK